jgi:hypothetical protein
MWDRIALAAVLVALLVLVLARLPPVRAYLEGLGGELGKRDAARLDTWRRQRRARRTESQVEASQRPQRPPELTLPSGLSGRAALLLVSVPDKVESGLLKQAIGLLRVGWIESFGWTAEGIDSASGEEQDHRTRQGLDGWKAVLSEAASVIEEGEADYIAVFLHLPISGSWFADRQLDLGAFFSAIYESTSAPVLVFYEEPVDISGWPDQVFFTSPAEPALLREFFESLGVTLESSSLMRSSLMNRESLSLSREEAAHVLLAISGNDVAAAIYTASEDQQETLPAYSAHLALAIGIDAFVDGQAELTSSTSLTGDLPAALRHSRISVSGQPDKSLLPRLPPANHRGVVMAWRDRLPPSIVPARKEVPASSGNDYARELREATQARKGKAAAEILANHGRSWIESEDLHTRLPLLRSALDVFSIRSETGLWANYLLALDGALRRSMPDVGYFSPASLEVADEYRFGLLYRAERMEFARLSGDLEGAYRRLSPLLEEIESLPPPSSESGQLYIRGTALFVLANVLRRGGRYDRARELIETATGLLNSEVPSHRVELLHCRYALAVCSSMFGMARVERVEQLGSTTRVFGQALVTLSNTQAAWIVRDFERAREFSASAASIFRSIGYRRYAQRADDVGELVSLWTHMEKLGGPSGVLASELSRLAYGTATSAPGSTISLNHLRPSAALSILQFGLAFAESPREVRVSLPSCLVETDTGLEVLELGTIASLYEADAALRSAMGIGLGTSVPLLPD